MTSAPFRRVALDGLRIDDERAMRQVAIYPRLKAALVRGRHRFRVPAPGAPRGDWNRALLLNLGFWSPDDAADVLVDERIPADVVAHVAWHHVAARALGAAAGTADGLLLAESIASAFDFHLAGVLLREAAPSAFLDTQVPAMAEVARSAGLGARDFAALLAGMAADPDAAFVAQRALLFSVASGLVRARTTEAAARVLDGFAGHPFHPLLHHYNLSSWILYARAHAAPAPARRDPFVARIDRALRHPAALRWLERHWLGD